MKTYRVDYKMVGAGYTTDHHTGDSIIFDVNKDMLVYATTKAQAQRIVSGYHRDSSYKIIFKKIREIDV